MIFYEKEHAENLLKNGFTSFMSFSDLSLLAKYFKHLGKNKEQIRKDLIDFCKKYNPDFNEILSYNKIKNAVNLSDDYCLRMPININITKAELETIKNAGNYRRQSIAFVILVLAKYSKYNDNRINHVKKTKYSDNFYARADISDIIKLSGNTIKHDEFTNILGDFIDNELIIITLTHSFQILFVNEESPVAITVTDLEKMISFYPFFCENCGEIIIKKSKKHSLCKECYKDLRRETWAKSKRKIRGAEKE